MSHTVWIALGSNLGDRLSNLKAAVAALPPEVRPVRTSPVYETPPWGYADQPAFLNQVLQAETDLDPAGLLQRLKRLEAGLGRRATFRYGPRRIDLDILFYDDRILETPELIIPHPHLAERAFVLIPLADLAPDWQHPVLKRTMRELREQVDAQGIRLYDLEEGEAF